MKKLCLFVASFLIFHSAHADLATDCMQAISDKPEFQTAMMEIFDSPDNFTQEFVTQNKAKIFGTIGSTMLVVPKCTDNIATIARRQNGKVWLTHNNQKYAFQFGLIDLFKYLSIPTGIMVYNKATLAPGTVIKLEEIPKLYWSDECSDHTIWDNNDDDTAVNKAGQKVFSQYGGSENEFFLDFEEGNDRRAFPGLVLMDKTGSGSESIVAFNNLHTSMKAAEDFAATLKGSACARDGLSVYTVALNTQKLDDQKNTIGAGKEVWGYAAGITGGATTLVVGSAALKALGIATAVTTKILTAAHLTAATAAAATAGAAAATTAGTVAASVGWVPIAGWIIAGAIAIGTGIYVLYPHEIVDLPAVMVLDGPHIIQ